MSAAGIPNIWRSLDGGSSWEDISYNLPRIGASSLSVNPHTGELFFGSCVGTWIFPSPNQNMPSLNVSSVTANPTTMVPGNTSIITAYVTNESTGQAVTDATVIGSVPPSQGTIGLFVHAIGGNYTATYTAPAVTTVCRITVNASKLGYSNGSGHVDVTVSTGPVPEASAVAVLIIGVPLILMVADAVNARKTKRMNGIR
jgi:hypothetical protein